MTPDNQNILRKIVYVLGALLILIVIFQLGVSCGYRRAEYSYIWRNNYSQDMFRPFSFMAPFMHDADDVNPNSAIGDLVSVDLPHLLVKGQYQSERTVVIGATTTIRFADGMATTSDLQVGKQVIVIGIPDNEGQIHATFIRILGNPPGTTTPSS